MSRLVGNRWFLPIVVLLFSVAGLVLVSSSDPNTRLSGASALLFFGLGGGSLVAAESIAPPAAARFKGVAALPDGSEVPALILPFRQLNSTLLVTAALGAAAGLALFALSPSGEGLSGSVAAHAVVGLGAVAFALTVPLRILSRPKSAGSITFTGPGLILRWPLSTASIPWGAIAAVSRSDVYGNPQLRIVVSSPNQIVWSGTGASWRLPNQLPMPRRIAPVSLRQLSVAPDDVVALANRFLDQARRAPAGTGRLGLPDGAEAILFPKTDAAG
jgi:hypothetical protein